MTTAMAPAVGRSGSDPRRLTRELGVFAAVGAASTLVHLGGFVVLREVAAPQVANGVALLVSAVANTWANRRFTFGIRGREGLARHQVQGLVVFALTLVMTSGGLALLAALAHDAPTWAETGVVAMTTAAATAVKYASMRWWVFRAALAPAGRPSGSSAGPPSAPSVSAPADAPTPPQPGPSARPSSDLPRAPRAATGEPPPPSVDA